MLFQAVEIFFPFGFFSKLHVKGYRSNKLVFKYETACLEVYQRFLNFSIRLDLLVTNVHGLVQGLITKKCNIQDNGKPEN